MSYRTSRSTLISAYASGDVTGAIEAYYTLADDDAFYAREWLQGYSARTWQAAVLVAINTPKQWVTHVNMLERLCVAYVERVKALGIKGKKRDDGLLDFMIGAIHALEAQGDPSDAGHVKRVTVMIFSVRGYAECAEIARAAIAKASGVA